MRLKIPLPDKVGLDHQDDKPSQKEKTMDDKFRITIAFLPDIIKQVVRESDQGENQQKNACPGKVVFCHLVERMFVLVKA